MLPPHFSGLVFLISHDWLHLPKYEHFTTADRINVGCEDE